MIPMPADYLQQSPGVGLNLGLINFDFTNFGTSPD